MASKTDGSSRAAPDAAAKQAHGERTAAHHAPSNTPSTVLRTQAACCTYQLPFPVPYRWPRCDTSAEHAPSTRTPPKPPLRTARLPQDRFNVPRPLLPQDGQTANHGHARHARFQNSGRGHYRATTSGRRAHRCAADPSQPSRRIRGDITARCAELACENTVPKLAFGRGHPDSEGKHPTNDSDDHKRPRYHDDLLFLR